MYGMIFQRSFSELCLFNYLLFVSLFTCKTLVSVNSSVSKPDTINIHKQSFGS